ncbi:MAG: TRAP transporter substrate-binding protein [Propionibacteriaceae bacterium]|nr:TRAP transporter substrate-binding protein [Propionibacteriaceae bacterium]
MLTTAACSRHVDDGGDAVGSSADSNACTSPIKTFKLAFNQTAEHPQYAAGITFGERLMEETGGCYDIEVYPNETLGTQASVLNNISDGSIELAWVAGGVMEPFNADFVVFNLPYVFDSIESEIATLNDHDGAMYDLEHSIEESKRITVLTGVTAGTRNVYNSTRPIKTPADMQGLKLRVQQSDSQVKMIELMGGVPTTLGLGEVYSALQTGTLDGAENNEVTWDAMSHDEVAKYYSYTRHLIMPDYLVASTNALEVMSEEHRAALMDLIPEVAQVANDGFADFTADSLAHAESIGALVNDDVDIDAFKAVLTPFTKESINNDARQKLYDAALANNELYPAK